MLGRSDYQWQHEPVLYGFLQNGKHPWYSDRKQTTIWNFAKPKRNENHPTSKPLDLLAYPICNSSQENSIVIDTFGGSGSTMMACEKTGRICYMMELDPKYASVILRRYVEDFGGEDQVYVERDGQKLMYATFTKGTIEFRLFQFDAPDGERQNGIHAGQLKSYIQLCLALSELAKEVKTASSKPQQSENPKFAMRTWLMRLGFIGEEFATARDFLTRNLDGDAAFRFGRAA